MTAKEYKLRTEELINQLEQRNSLINELTEEVKALLLEYDYIGD